MSTHTPTAEFVQKLTEFQNRIYAFIYSLLGNASQAEDVLQETNTVIWKEALKSDEPIIEFKAWAFQIAFNQVRSHRKKISRERLTFNDDLLEQISESLIANKENENERQQALADCLHALPHNHQNIIKKRYFQGLSVKDLSGEIGKTANAIAVILFRSRVALMECIQKKTVKKA